MLHLQSDLEIPFRQSQGRPDRAKVICMLPARNAAAYIPGWLESVASFADGVVALDDGSTDGTAELLEAHPLVEILLRNPRRDGFQGWHDSTNRNRLLQAAGLLDPDWVIGIDADELVPPDEGETLRRFIDEQAMPGIAYAFPVYRMIGDLEHYDRRDNRAALRLFAYRPGQVIPTGAHHVPPGARVDTAWPAARDQHPDPAPQRAHGPAPASSPPEVRGGRSRDCGSRTSRTPTLRRARPRSGCHAAGTCR